MRPITCGGIRYESIRECVDRTEYTIKQIQYALEVTGHIGVVSIEYADDPIDSIVAAEPSAAGRSPLAKTVLLLHGLCTHRLGTYHGGRY